MKSSSVDSLTMDSKEWTVCVRMLELIILTRCWNKGLNLFYTDPSFKVTFPVSLWMSL